MSADGGRRNRQIWLYPLTILGVAAAAVFLGIFLVDLHRVSPPSTGGTGLGRLFAFDPDTAQNALGNLAQVITAVLGIVITVVSIVVQLASTRYTPRVAEMFFRDRTNLFILGFFVVAGIDAVWVSLSVSSGFVPRASITASLVMVTLSILMMVPYFSYVFDFLDPEKVVARIQEQALDSVSSRRAHRDEAPARQGRVLLAVEQLGDVAMNAVAQKDKLIAQGAVDALRKLLTSYLPIKRSAGGDWFAIGPRLRQNPDFVSMAADSVDGLAAQRVWLEWKVMRQYQGIFGEALGKILDVSNLVAIDTRYIGEAALKAGDLPALGLVIKFFNTYLRATINGEQVRTAYNTFNQYRLLVEALVASSQEALAVEVAGHFRYYSLAAHARRLTFVTETVAYDLASLCETAHGRRAGCHDRLLRVLLDLDREAETAEGESMLRGVRKAQIKLAAYYLSVDAGPHARAIFEDMRAEPAPRMASIRDELLAVGAKDFWEVNDRGANFDYMDEQRKHHLRTFFAWFPSLPEPGVASVRG